MARKRKESGGTVAMDSRLLDALGIVGCGAIEPVILAALAQQDPLLLIGPHGTGKSMLLTRLSAALGLEFRHYNASLLSFDDLVGYPLPDASGSLKYVQTPATIWGAQAVFFDEISRCRPEIQNKLFSIIHERKVQGMGLEGLAYRWSAMNPPVTDEAADYAGSEPLDRALADRFSLIVELPGWSSMSPEQQERLILTGDGPVPEEAAGRIQKSLGRISRMAAATRRFAAPKLSAYVRVVTGLLNQGGIGVSPRRAVMLFRNICGVHAARVETADGPSLEDSAFIALTSSLCQRALGESVSPVKVAAAHKEAWMAAADSRNGALQAVVLEMDPLRRGLMALSLDGVSKSDFSTIVADCLAALKPGARHAFAARVFESPAAGQLVAAVAEQCAELYDIVCTPQNLQESVAANGVRHRVWQRVVQRLGKLPKRAPETSRAENVLVGLFAKQELATPDDVDRAIDGWIAANQEIASCRA